MINDKTNKYKRLGKKTPLEKIDDFVFEILPFYLMFLIVSGFVAFIIIQLIRI